MLDKAYKERSKLQECLKQNMSGPGGIESSNTGIKFAQEAIQNNQSNQLKIQRELQSIKIFSERLEQLKCQRQSLSEKIHFIESKIEDIELQISKLQNNTTKKPDSDVSSNGIANLAGLAIGMNKLHDYTGIKIEEEIDELIDDFSKAVSELTLEKIWGT